jgi:alpha-galactosidase
MTFLSRRTLLKSSLLLAGNLPALAAPSDDSQKLSSVRLPFANFEATLGFILDPPVGEWRPQGGFSPSDYIYLGGDYRLELRISERGQNAHTVQFKVQSGRSERFKVVRYSIRVRVPFTGIYRVWHYQSGPLDLIGQFLSYTRGLASSREFTQLSGANTAIPVITCTDREGRNRLTLGVLDQVECTGLRIENYSLGLSPRAEGLNYVLEFSKPVGYSVYRQVLNDGVYLNHRSQTWFETVEDYSNWVRQAQKIVPLKPPAAAFEPVWCSWYPFGQDVHEINIEANARLCKQVGITTLLIDAGYNNSLKGGMDTPDNIDLFNDHTGDWTANATKFPDFPALIGRIHAQGQRVTAWVALFMVGKATRNYSQVHEMLKKDSNSKETLYLCPQHPQTPEYLARTFLKAAQDYDLDGYWLDFMDSLHLPCHASHPHAVASPGEGYNRCLIAVRDALLKFKQEFIIETRMKMANLNAQSLVNVLETTDMPFDFDINRSLGVFLRAFGKGSAVKLDPAQWHVHERTENVAKLCATVVLCGIPVFSLDLRLLPPAHLDVITAWLNFYRVHQGALTQARLEPLSFEPYFPALRLDSGSGLFVYLGSAAIASTPVRRRSQLFLINASEADQIRIELEEMETGTWEMRTQNCFLKETRKEQLQVKTRRLLLNRPVPQGGMLSLRKG